MAGLKVKIGADASQFERTMKSVRKDIGGVKTAILGVAGAVGAIKLIGVAFDAAGASARGLFSLLKSSSSEASGIESLTMQFETLLGGVDAAQARMEEITKFAASTPFEIKELAAASKQLQTVGGAMLSTGDGLRMVGDAAAIAGQPIGEVAVHVGRLFNQLQGGPIATESANRLLELGIANKTLRRDLEDVTKAQKSGKVALMDSSQAMAFLQKAMGSTAGAMDRLSATTEGKTSNMRDNISQLKVALGTGINEGLRDALDSVNNWLPQWKEKLTSIGKDIGFIIKQAVEQNYEPLVAIGAAIGTALKDGLKLSLEQTGGGIAETAVRGLSKFAGAVEMPIMQGKLEGVANTMREGNNIGLRSGIRNIGANISGTMDQLSTQRIQTEGKVTQGVGGSQWRQAMPGEQTPYFNPRTGERMVEILSKIDQKLTPALGN